MPSRSHPGVSRHRASKESEVDVLDRLSAAGSRAAAAAISEARGQTGDRSASCDDEDAEKSQDDEDRADSEEEARVSAENLSKVPPFVPPAGWIMIMPPDSQEDFDTYVWKGKRLAMKFEGGWSIGSFRRKGRRTEKEAGQSWFFYKDKGAALLPHTLMLTECGPSKTWVIIQEVAKVLSANEATCLIHSGPGSSYARHYQRRMGATRRVRGGDICIRLLVFVTSYCQRYNTCETELVCVVSIILPSPMNITVAAGGNAGIDAGAASEAGNDAGAGPAGAASDTQTLSGDEHELFQVETNVKCS